jgi:predicted enzyme related to lactoylglutathione lyase
MPARKRPTKTKTRPRAQTPNRRAASTRKTRQQTRADVPQFFRLSVEVGDLDAGMKFYSELLRVQGRKQPGARCYFQCGPVTLSVLDVSSTRRPHAAAKALYFTVKDLDAAFARAEALGCLSGEEVHDAPGGGIVVRPWGERSFYAEDPWHNPLCFVEDGTVYSG